MPEPRGPVDLARCMTAEAVGTALLLATVVGSGIMAERLAGGNVAIALLGNTLATGAILVALILTFGPISGAHFNPVVTLADASQRGLRWAYVPGYLAAVDRLDKGNLLGLTHPFACVRRLPRCRKVLAIPINCFCLFLGSAGGRQRKH